MQILNEVACFHPWRMRLIPWAKACFFLFFFFKWPKLIKSFVSLFLGRLQNEGFLVNFFSSQDHLRHQFSALKKFSCYGLANLKQVCLDKNKFVFFNKEMSWSKMNINKFVYKNKAIVGLCLGSTVIWAINLSGQFLMAHIFGQP